jgi:transposase
MTTTDPPPMPSIGEILDRLSRIEAALQTLVREKTVKEWYSTAEVAALLDRSEYSVREWCRQARVVAVKKPTTRGLYAQWLISHEEVQRLRNHGLRPITKLP